MKLLFSILILLSFALLIVSSSSSSYSSSSFEVEASNLESEYEEEFLNQIQKRGFFKSVGNFFTDIWDGVKKAANKLKDKSVNFFNGLSNAVKDRYKQSAERFVNSKRDKINAHANVVRVISGDSYLKGQFNNMVDKLRSKKVSEAKVHFQNIIKNVKVVDALGSHRVFKRDGGNSFVLGAAAGARFFLGGECFVGFAAGSGIEGYWECGPELGVKASVGADIVAGWAGSKPSDIGGNAISVSAEGKYIAGLAISLSWDIGSGSGSEPDGFTVAVGVGVGGGVSVSYTWSKTF